MTAEQKYFLTISGDFLHSRESINADGLDWTVICSYAKSHLLQGILYYQCKNFMPPENAKSLMSGYIAAISIYANRIAILKKIDAVFSQNNIPYILFKGTEVAAYYPVPSLRTMGDCDILVHREDKDRAGECLLGIGFTGGEHDETEWHFRMNGLDFELHHRLLYDEDANTETGKSFCDTVWDYAMPDADSPESSRYVLDINYHYIYLLLHLKKHILNYGAGFRQFFDLAVIRKFAGIDMDEVNSLLQKADVVRFNDVCTELCNRWFMSESDDSVFDSDFYEKSTETIFKNGVFGFDNESNKNGKTLNTIRKKGKIGTILCSLFPSYEHCRYISYYSFVDGKPYLMPIVWIYRFYRMIRYGKLNDSKNNAIMIMKSEKTVGERERNLTEWGI